MIFFATCDPLSQPKLAMQRNYIMMRWLNFILLMASFISSFQYARAETEERPNILLILADDVGREVLECYGGSSYETPNLNQLAASGAMLEHCYAMPVCHPTRVTLMTGQYPRHLNNPKWVAFRRCREPHVRERCEECWLRNSRCGEVAVVLAERRHGTAAKNGL